MKFFAFIFGSIIGFVLLAYFGFYVWISLTKPGFVQAKSDAKIHLASKDFDGFSLDLPDEQPKTQDFRYGKYDVVFQCVLFDYWAGPNTGPLKVSQIIILKKETLSSDSNLEIEKKIFQSDATNMRSSSTRILYIRPKNFNFVFEMRIITVTSDKNYFTLRRPVDDEIFERICSTIKMEKIEENEIP